MKNSVFKKWLSPEWAAVIVSVVALGVSVVSCILIRTSNSIDERLAHLEEARYTEAHSPAFSFEYAFPSCATATNTVESRKFLRDLKIYNRGYPVQDVCSIMIETFAVVSTFDKVKMNELEKIVPVHHAFYVLLSNHIEKRFYNTYRHTFDTKGLLFEAEHGAHQYGLLDIYNSYKASFPNREIHIDIVDITTLDYVDHKGKAHRVQFLNGSARREGDLNRQIREGHAIMKAIRENDKKQSRHTTLSSILEYCYEYEDVLTRKYRAKADGKLDH